MNDLRDDTLEQRLRAACREMIPRLTDAPTIDDDDTELTAWSGGEGESLVVEFGAVRHHRSRPRMSGLVGAAAAVLLVIGGLAVLQRDDQSAAGTATVAPPPAAGATPAADSTAVKAESGSTQRFTFATPTVSLSADSISVIDGDQIFTPTNAQAHSEPGGDKYATLEITWTEGGAEQRIFIFFTSDGTHWWAREIRTYDTSKGRPDWHQPIATGEFFTTPLGSAFTGDLDLPNLRITGMTLQAFGPPAACEAPAAPVALIADYPEIVAAPGGFGASLQLIDTAACTGIPVANYTFEYASDDPTIAIASAGWPNNGSMPIEATTIPADQSSPTTTMQPFFETRARASLQLLAPGNTTIHATARDQNGVIVATADMRVTVTEAANP
ncbi:MAG: hypothetical protein RI958_58 [Actinomycetota bacterium]|jgi:hypothetical protein